MFDQLFEVGKSFLGSLFNFNLVFSSNAIEVIVEFIEFLFAHYRLLQNIVSVINSLLPFFLFFEGSFVYSCRQMIVFFMGGAALTEIELRLMERATLIITVKESSFI
jgi:hypothetical protein